MIELKYKACKGQNKAKGVKGCGKQTKYRKYGLCSSCLTDFLLNTDAGKIIVEKARLKACKPRLEAEKSLNNEIVRRKTESEIKRLKGLAEHWVHRYVRERDKYLPCISSQVAWRPDFQAGHLFPKGKIEGLRYDLDNINSQSIGDNIFNEGNVEAYRINLINRIGKEKVDELDKKAAYWKANPKRWTVEELKEIINNAKKLYKEIKE